jgi:hypothetical protein
MCNMFNNTCLVALKIKDWSTRTLGLEIIVYLILESSYISFEINSPNAQAYNHTNAAIIRIGIARRERGRDSENFGTRIN